jgi:hypothetical protein
VTTVALATCAQLPNLDEDGPALVVALRTRGVDAVPAVWDDPEVDWARFDLVVVRSTWDYPPRRDAFLEWSRRVPRILNEPRTLAWNTDKRYLTDLTRDGLPVIPTRFLSPGDAFVAPDDDYVVKPAVSAGSRDTARYRAADADRAATHVATLHAQGRVVMVQPYLEAVDEAGETALLYLGGELSHAVRKGPLLRPGAPLEAGLFADEDIRPAQATAAQRAVGDAVMRALASRVPVPLYARVDMVPASDGSPLVLEVELTEPSLFLGHGAGAAERFADLIAAANRG